MTEPIEPETRTRMTLMQQVLLAIAIAGGMGGAGYTAGVVHAQIEDHEHAPGHKEALGRIRKLEESQIKIATVLELMERRTRRP